ncbi:hypothetical protein SAMN05660226_03099 [Parapedobacter luteus]|uniref:Uncharacterized protein n=1 Tax=Parapedobacter luteus TaxID=623280 RepID=A0A1T5E1R7_9SPHI|nr:hypothetical protein SAMN05660226_03099 [Parapedobacter luteus]
MSKEIALQSTEFLSVLVKIETNYRFLSLKEHERLLLGINFTITKTR